VLIEDDEEIRTLIQTVLSAEGHRVVGTGDPTRAVEMVRAEAPDLVICDIMMPVMDGYAVLRALQADPSTSRYPVMFLTARQEFNERVRAFRFGVVDYLTKPFTREVLLRKVENVVDGRARRVGFVADEGAAAPAALMDELQKQARSGILTLTGQDGESQIVVRAGEIVEAPASGVPERSARAEFQELDAAHEEIVAPDPPSLPRTRAPLPTFDSFPELLRHVLIVDDNATFRTFLRDLLRGQGFLVREASNGEEGLDMALEHRPWLILTDVRMPVADGFELCRQVRSHSLIRNTPLLFLSGWDDYKQRYRGLELGADDFLSKETPIRELLVRIQLILQRYSDLGVRGRRGAAMGGGIDVVGAPGILQMCHLTRLTGILTAMDGPRHAEIRFREGEIVSAESAAEKGTAAVFEFLSWEGGSFEFNPVDPGPGQGLGQGFDQVVLEGCRRLDEARRGPEAAEPAGEA
jgi:DNA-binding response OmpR family regulator